MTTSKDLSRRHFGLLTLAALPALSGCRNKEEELKGKLLPALDEVMPLIDRDTKQVRDGLPKGAALMARHLDEDPGSDLEGVKRAIESGRAGVDELEVAKSTFFVFVAPDGIVLRGQTEPDLPAGKSLTDAVPDAKKFLSKDAGLVEVWGYMKGLRGVNKGGDLQWIVGHPVKSKEGALLGAFVTGWSLRKYAEYLENHVKIHMTKTAAEPTKPIPLVYVFIVKGNAAFGGPVTPEENATAVAELGLVDKVKGGSYEAALQLDGRRFLLAARPAPAMGDDVAIALLMSPI
jgi:hypothetical protein